MIWTIAVGCFLAGAVAGALLLKIFRSNEVQVRELKQQLLRLSEEHENYKSSVHSHFSGTARLFGQLTDSYREVYRHMAEGAAELCPYYISASLMLSNETKSLLRDDQQRPYADAPASNEAISTADEARQSASEEADAPADYAARSDRSEAQPAALSE
jgi:uncharacterized membrane-anchored protein YhcB (DUF1043 family)